MVTQSGYPETWSKMTPAEKVGQLFLISFKGREVANDSPVYDMIVNHHVGGVILNQRNDNFSSDNTINNAQNLVNNLQQAEWNDAQSQFTDLSSRLIINNNYIPLFATGTSCHFGSSQKSWNTSEVKHFTLGITKICTSIL